MPGSNTDARVERRLASEHQTLARPLGAIVRDTLVVCEGSEPVGTALARMRAGNVDCIVVTHRDSLRPRGIFTTSDLVDVVLGGSALDAPVETLMTGNPVALPAHTPAYEAALVMIERGIRHVLVTDGERLVGVVAERELFALQRLGLGELTVETRLARDVGALAAVAGRVQRLAQQLVDQGLGAEQLMTFVSVLNDRISQRLVELVRQRHRWQGIGWCWLAFGSEGRIEQTFATDQDNGLVFEAHAATSPAETRKALLAFAREVNEGLDACGFPLCQGNVMASNPQLCLSVAEWKDKIGGWIESPEPEALLQSAICFDLRALAGDARLASELTAFVLDGAQRRPNFLRLMAENALKARPPLARFGRLRTEAGADGNPTLNLKLYAIRPVVDCARVFALARGIGETSTIGRLRRAGLPPAECDAAVAAFSFIQTIRLRHQAATVSRTDVDANRIDPARLNALDLRTLKEAFRIVRELQSRLALDYAL